MGLIPSFHQELDAALQPIAVAAPARLVDELERREDREFGVARCPSCGASAHLDVIDASLPPIGRTS